MVRDPVAPLPFVCVDDCVDKSLVWEPVVPQDPVCRGVCVFFHGSVFRLSTSLHPTLVSGLSFGVGLLCYCPGDGTRDVVVTLDSGEVMMYVNRSSVWAEPSLIGYVSYVNAMRTGASLCVLVHIRCRCDDTAFLRLFCVLRVIVLSEEWAGGWKRRKKPLC